MRTPATATRARRLPMENILPSARATATSACSRSTRTPAKNLVGKIGGELDNRWGSGPRGTPTVDGDRVYALSGKGDLACINVADGKVIWTASMNALGGKTPGWGYTESVLVDGDKVVCTPGGSSALAAFNKADGKAIWRSTDFTDDAQYASIIPADINGQRQYIQLTMQHLVGISAKDGKQLWSSDWPGQTAVIPTPIYRDSHVYISSGYGVGCKLVKIEAGNKATTVYENKVMKNHHGGVILVGIISTATPTAAVGCARISRAATKSGQSVTNWAKGRSRARTECSIALMKGAAPSC